MATTIINEVEGFKHTAIANYSGSVKTTLVELATGLDIPATFTDDKGNDKPLKVEELKEEIYLNSNNKTLIVVDNAHRWAASLRYWLESLQEKGVVLMVLAIEDLKKDLFIRLLKVDLSPPSQSQIRELMIKEAVNIGVDLSPSNLSKLQQLAGNNPMLAKKVIHESRLGLLAEVGEHRDYLDISPFVNGGLTLLGVVRFIGLGMGDRSLYIFGGIAMLLAISLRYFGKGFNQRNRRLGR